MKSWKTHASLFSGTPAEATEYAGEFIRRLGLQGERARDWLTLMFERVAELAKEQGRKEGVQAERNVNPSWRKLEVLRKKIEDLKNALDENNPRI